MCSLVIRESCVRASCYTLGGTQHDDAKFTLLSCLDFPGIFEGYYGNHLYMISHGLNLCVGYDASKTQTCNS